MFEFKVNLAELIPIAISIFALYIALKNRRNALRENIYNRQLEIYTQLHVNLLSIEDTLLDWELAKKQNDIHEMNEFSIELNNKIDTFIESNFKSVLLLPDEVDKVLLEIINFLSEIKHKIHENKYTENDSVRVGDKLFDFEETVRSHIGLEKLSRENRRLIK